MLQVVRDPADVIFMAVGDDHAADPPLVFPQKAGVRHDHVDAMHAIAGEGQTGIHQDQIITKFKNAGVLADLMQSTQGNDLEGGLLGLGTVGSHVGSNLWNETNGDERLSSTNQRLGSSGTQGGEQNSKGFAK